MEPYCHCNAANLRGKVKNLPMSGWTGCELRPQIVNTKNMTKEQFINNLDDEIMIAKIIKELKALRDTSEMSNE